MDITFCNATFLFPGIIQIKILFTIINKNKKRENQLKSATLLFAMDFSTVFITIAIKLFRQIKIMHFPRVLFTALQSLHSKT